MFERALNFDTGPATLIPLVHVPLLKDAPRQEGDYKVLIDTLGDLCHFYGDFSGYHLYFIASCLKKRIVQDSLDYYDKKNGKYSVSLATTSEDGTEHVIRIENCEAPLCEKTADGITYPEKISIERFSGGAPDALKFHFSTSASKFKFSNNLIPGIPEKERFASSGIFDLNIEYIGKAVGENGTREVADRLGNGHSTESLILNEFVHKKTNLDAYAIMYKPGRLTDKSGNEDPTFSYSDVIDVLEKSLIARFLPEKNKQNRNFPDDGSITTKKLIDNKVALLKVAVESPSDYGLLYTADVEPERVHRFALQVRDRY